MGVKLSAVIASEAKQSSPAVMLRFAFNSDRLQHRDLI
jgi:hypothetical protein